MYGTFEVLPYAKIVSSTFPCTLRLLGSRIFSGSVSDRSDCKSSKGEGSTVKIFSVRVEFTVLFSVYASKTLDTDGDHKP